MKFDELRDRVAVVRLEDESYEYLGQTAVIKQPHTLPYRIVLVHAVDPNTIIVYTQSFNKYNWANGVLYVSNPSFSSGQYYTPDELAFAFQTFGQRVAEHAHNFFDSIYREDAKHIA